MYCLKIRSVALNFIVYFWLCSFACSDSSSSLMKMLHVKDDAPSSPASLKGAATEQRPDDAKDGAAAMSAAELEAQWLKV